MTLTLDDFTRGYIECALWSSAACGSPQEDAADPADADGQRRGTFDQSFQDCGIDELSPALLAHVIADCVQFQDENSAKLALAYTRYSYSPEWSPESQAGHDFWLTRNGHGTGFWDRGLGLVGADLANVARAWGVEDWIADASDLENIVVTR